jgi:hypothetical protein
MFEGIPGEDVYKYIAIGLVMLFVYWVAILRPKQLLIGNGV